MKHSSQPSRLPADLSESISQRLNMYALGAAAAGVGVLALAPPSEAKIVYTRADVSLGYGVTGLDLDNDGRADFEFCRSLFISTGTYKHPYSCPSARPRSRKIVRPPDEVGSALSIYPHGGKNNTHNRIWGTSKGAFALPRGVCVGPKINFTPGGQDMATWISSFGSSGLLGPWANVQRRYLALKFLIKGRVHYGWARLTVLNNHGLAATLTGYAYETIPGKSIRTGQTKGPEDVVEGPDATLTAPSPKPASLGLLAIGAPGLFIWRRRESVGATVSSS
jgi:hypothetical protein